MKVFTVANQKGGVGKSTTALALASIFNDRGCKTLLIDCDTQCNSSDTYGAEMENVATVYDVLFEESSVAEAVQHTDSGDILAGDYLLRQADEKLRESSSGMTRLARALEGVEGYEYVIIDTAPTLNSLLINGLAAADEVIIPVIADRYSINGLYQLNDTIRMVRSRYNPRLAVSGLLLTMFNARSNLAKEAAAALTDLAAIMDTRVFDTRIRRSTKCMEAQAHKKMLIHYASKSITAMDYQALADEILTGGAANG